MRIVFANDHRGIDLKDYLIADILTHHYYKCIDFGTNTHDISVDYPDYAHTLCNYMLQEMVLVEEPIFGVLICGTGIGMSIAANRFQGIRAALCHNPDTAILARQHNNANILILAANTTPLQYAKDILDVFVNTEFEYGRHVNRLLKLDISK